MQHRAIIKAFLHGCPLTDSLTVNLPFNWRGHKKRGAASITNVFFVSKDGSKRERERERERETGREADRQRCPQIAWVETKQKSEI